MNAPVAEGWAGSRICRSLATGAVLLAMLFTTVACMKGESFSKRLQLEMAASVPKSDAPPLPKLVATYRDVAPDMLIYSAGRHSGPLRHVIEEAAARSGHSVEWKPAPFAQSLAKAESGEIDIVPFVRFKTPEREKVLRFSEGMGRVSTYTFFLQHADDPNPIKTLEDLRGRTIGFRPGSFYFDEFNTDTRFKKVGYPDDEKLIKGFIDRKVNVVLVNIRQATERTLASSGYSPKNYKYAELVIEREAELYMLYSRVPARQPIYDRLDQAIVKMRQEGLIEEIYRSFEASPPRAK